VFEEWWARLKYAPILEEDGACTSANKPEYKPYPKFEGVGSLWKNRVLDFTVTCVEKN
jgi:hypothetical protein